MLIHPTVDKLNTLRLSGMVKALEEQSQMSDIGELSFEERLGLLVDREMTERDNRSLKRRLKKARLRQNASMEDIDLRHSRGMEKAVISKLASCRWIKDRLNILITGPTGVGKSYIGCALAQKACREGFSALYTRLPRLFQDLSIARGDGRYGKLLAGIAKADLLVLDDWGLYRLSEEERRDILEIMEDRHDIRSTIVASQVPVEDWHDVIGDPTLADAIIDRLIHNAYRITLKGESMRQMPQGKG